MNKVSPVTSRSRRTIDGPRRVSLGHQPLPDDTADTVTPHPPSSGVLRQCDYREIADRRCNAKPIERRIYAKLKSV